MDLVSLLISLASGAAGGNIAGWLLKERSLGLIGNSLAGIFGGGIGASILQALGLIASAGIFDAEGGVDLVGLLANIASSGVGGAVLLLIVSFLKKLFNK